MRTLIGTVALLVTAYGGVAQAADVGDVVPDFCCLDENGNTWDSRDHVGKWPVVVYFYPSDFAFCCTRQARRYQAAQGDLSMECAEVIGISCDVAESHRLFKTANDLTFSLLSDDFGSLAQMFDVPLRLGGKAMATGPDGEAICLPRRFTAARCTFVIGIDGRIARREMLPSPVNDSQGVLEFLRQANGQE
jgi:peroxiredoxin Q/BCP